MLNNATPEKRIAIALYKLSWWERRQLLNKLSNTVRLSVIEELATLKKMKIKNIDLFIDSPHKVKVEVFSQLDVLDEAGFSSVFKSALIINLTSKESKKLMVKNTINDVISELKHQGEI